MGTDMIQRNVNKGLLENSSWQIDRLIQKGFRRKYVILYKKEQIDIEL